MRTFFRSGILTLASAMVLLEACGDAPGPREVMKTWLGHLARGEVEAAWGLLTDSSRDRISTAEQAWFDGRMAALVPKDPPGKKATPAEGLTLFRRLIAGPGFDGVVPVPRDAADRVEAATIDGDEARVRVRTGSGHQEAVLHLETDGWRIALIR